MTYQDRSHHEGDPFASTRMSFGAHLEDLRSCLWRAVAGFILILLLVFFLDFLGGASGLPIGVGKPVMNFIISPVKRELAAYHQRRDLQIAKDLRSGNRLARSADEPREIPLVLEVHELARELAPH
jgi:hypothetical protein